jgi:hypothetical protein
MALIITGIFIQFLCLAVQVIQLRLGRRDDPGQQCPVPAARPAVPRQGRRRKADTAEAGESDEHTREASATTPLPGHGENRTSMP